MRNLVFTVLACLPCLSYGATLGISAPGLKRIGVLVLAVFDDEKKWSSNSEPIATSRTPVATDGVTLVALTLPPGRYAIMAFHDANADTILNTSFVGKPTEAYGFSNDARGVFGAPKWKAASFQLDGDSEMTLRLR